MSSMIIFDRQPNFLQQNSRENAVVIALSLASFELQIDLVWEYFEFRMIQRTCEIRLMEFFGVKFELL